MACFVRMLDVPLMTAADNRGLPDDRVPDCLRYCPRVGAGYGVEIPPKVVSDLIYQRKVDVHACPVVAGRRLVPRNLLPAVLQALRERGVIPERKEVPK